MADELRACGVRVPGHDEKRPESLSQAGPEVHHRTAQESRRDIALYLREWQYRHPDDPAVHVSAMIISPLPPSVTRLMTTHL